MNTCMTVAPRDIKALRDQGILQVTWPDGKTVGLPFKFLRCACSCAACVDEMTGKPLLDPATVPENVSIAGMSLVGNYALKIDWTDGHATGLYTWDRLSSLEPPSNG